MKTPVLFFKNLIGKSLTKKVFALFFLIALTANLNVWGQQYTVTPTGGTAGNTNGIGADPICRYYNSIRYQVVYTATELTAAGMPANFVISKLAWNVTESSSSLANYTIKMGNTSATNSAANNTDATTTVKNAYTYSVATGWNDIVFDANFTWNGTSNIVVEICTGATNPYTSPYGGVQAKTGVTSGSRHYRVDGASACGTNTSIANTTKPYIRFTGSPACTAPISVSLSGFTTPICSGDNPGTFTATPAGGSPTTYTYLWYKGGVSTGITTQAYDAGVLSANTGIYCAVSTGTGCTTNSPTTTIYITPAVSTPSFSLGTTSSRCQGAGSVTYTASASNTTGITYTLDATSLSNGNSINASTGELTYAAGWSGTSIVTASAAGCGGPLTSAHTITVNQSLSSVAVTPIIDQDICETTSGSQLAVAETNGGTITNRQWGKRSSPGGTITPISGANSDTYTPTGSDLGIGTWYVVCTSTPTCGTVTVSNEVKIVVNTAPAITTHPQPLTLCAGGSGNFTVSTSASSPTYDWEVQDPTNPGVWIPLNINNSTYSLTNIDILYNGWSARAIVTEGGCPTTSNSAVLTVLANPSGGSIATANFCASTGSGSVSVTGVSDATQYLWALGSLSGSSTTSTITASGSTSGAYTVTVTPQNVSGALTCPATSSITGTVNVVANPSDPTTVTASDVSCSQLTLSWGASTNATGYEIQVSTASNFSNSLAGNNCGGFNCGGSADVGNVTTASITGLTANTQYWIRVRARNGALICRSNWTNLNTTSVTTALMPVAPVLTLSSANICPGTGSINATLHTPGSGGFNCSPTYEVNPGSGWVSYVLGNSVAPSIGSTAVQFRASYGGCGGAGCTTATNTYSCPVYSTISASATPTNMGSCSNGTGSIALTRTGGSGTYTYNWSSPNGYTSSIQNPSSLNSGVYNVTVTDASCPSNTATASATVTAAWSANAGSDIAGCTGSASLSGGTTGTLPSNCNSTGSASPNASIPDNSTTGVSSTISLTSTANASQLSSITININHTFDADLDITLYAPNGSSIDLSSDNGSSGDNYTNTVFSTSGAAITGGTAPFTGTYTPESAFSNLTGTANGNWILKVADDAGSDVGTFLNWSIVVNNTCTVTYSWSGPGGFTSPAQTPTITTPGTYTLSVSAGGCTSIDNVDYTMNYNLTAPSVTNNTGCKGTAVALSASGAAAGENYKWYDAATGGNLIQTDGSTYTTPVLSTTTNYWVCKYNTTTNCISQRTLVIANINNCYAAEIQSVSANATTAWCQGETKTVSVTIKNIGTLPWTDATPDINIGVKWNTSGANWTDYLVKTNALNLASGATGIYNLTLTASNAIAGPTYGTVLAAGTNNLTFDVVKEGDCSFGSNTGGCGLGNSVYATTAVTINALPTAVISYNGNPFCNSLSSAQSVTLSGTGAYTGGSYGSTAGLTINASTGAITPSTSTAGIYTVTYTIPASGGCSSVPVTTSVTITALPVITASSATTPICIGASPNLNATSSGNTILWYDSPSGGSPISTSASGVNSTYIPAASGTPTYYAEATTSVDAGSQIYSTPGSTNFIVPAGVTSVTVKCWGAGGAGSSTGGSGGSGAFVSGNLNVTPGASLVVNIGGGGTSSSSGASAGGFAGGGASGGPYGGSGGGYSGLFNGTISQANAIVIAGGGAGGGYYDLVTFGGAGGATTGSNGGNRDLTYTGGTGASTSTGGTGGLYNNVQRGSTGSALIGGAGYVISNYYGGGGGGGGYYGGGGGYGGNNTSYYSSGGGGGSSYLGSMTGTTILEGTTSSSGTATQAPGNSDGSYISGVGNGGKNTGVSGGNGLVVISWSAVVGCNSASRTAIPVTVNALPTVSISGSSAICVNATTNLSPSSGGTWSSSNSGLASVTNGGLVTGNAAGSPTFTFRDNSTTCINNTSVVTVNPLPSLVTATTANPSNGTICLGGSVDLTSSATSNGGTINYSEGFEAMPTPPIDWTFINAGFGNDWVYSTTSHGGSFSLCYQYNYLFASNVWAITQGNTMYAGTTYTISFWYKVLSATYPEKLKVTVGTTANVAGQTNILWNCNGGTSLANTTWAQATVTYTPLTNGTYYFGFNCYSDAYKESLYIDDISITGTTSATYSWSSSPAGYTNISQNPTGVTPSVTGITQYTVTAQNVYGCTATANTNVAVTVPTNTAGLVSSDYVWTGNAGTDWNNASNWLVYGGGTSFSLPSAGVLPSNSSNVFIRADAICGSINTSAIPTATASCANLTIENGRTLNLGTQTLNVTGNWTNNGAFTGTGSVVFNGSANSDVNGNNATSFYNVAVSKTGGAKVTFATQPLTATGFFNLNSGTLEITNTNWSTVAGNFTVNTGATFNHNVNWDNGDKGIRVSGDADISGTYSTNGVPAFVMDGSGTHYVKGNYLGYLAFQNGDFKANGAITCGFLLPMWDAAGKFYTNGKTISASNGLYNAGGTVYVDGGTLNITGNINIGCLSTNGAIEISSGAVTCDGLNLGDGTRTGTLAHSGGTLNVNGNLVIKASCSYTSSNSTALMNLSGNLTNNGSISASDGTTALIGTANQSITGSGSNTFYNLTVNNTHSGFVNGADNLVIVESPVLVNKKLTLTNGIIQTDTIHPPSTAIPVKILTIGELGTSDNYGNDHSFVWGFINKKGSANFIFPTGAVKGDLVKKVVWAPIGISTLEGTTTNFYACYRMSPSPENWNPGCMTGFLDHTSGKENWYLNGEAAKAIVTLYWKDDSWVPPYIDDPNNLRVAHWQESSQKWEDLGWASVTTPDGNGMSSITASEPTTGYSPFTFGAKNGSNALPIELTEFKGLCKGDSRELVWKTATETNNDYFTIESSKNGLDWTFVAKVQGAGNSNVEKSYSYNDITSESVLYYRLTQTDFNGQFKTFDPIVVNCKDVKDKSISIFPNPFQSIISVSLLNISDENITVNIYDMFGKLIEKSTYRISNGFNNMITLDMGDLPAGVYYLEVKATNYVKSTKIVKNK